MPLLSASLSKSVFVLDAIIFFSRHFLFLCENFAASNTLSFVTVYWEKVASNSLDFEIDKNNHFKLRSRCFFCIIDTVVIWVHRTHYGSHPHVLSYSAYHHSKCYRTAAVYGKSFKKRPIKSEGGGCLHFIQPLYFQIVYHACRRPLPTPIYVSKSY